MDAPLNKSSVRRALSVRVARLSFLYRKALLGQRAMRKERRDRILAPIMRPSAASRAFSWLALLRLAASFNSYFGQGWTDSNRATRDQGLEVKMDQASAALPENAEISLDDSFDWRNFEDAQGGTTRVQGKDGWKPTVLQSWEPRYDAVRHGYYNLYRFDDLENGTVLNGSMTDHFFQITMDVQVHPEYAARPEAALANSSIRFTLFEAPPADLSKPETSLNMVNYDAAYMGVLTGGNEWDVLTRRHRMTWGLVTDDTHTDGSFPSLSTNILTGASCTRNVSALYIGVQCLEGYAFPAGTCEPVISGRNRLDDCYRYCPFTLTIRAIPRVIKPETSVTTLMGPGQWQAFALDVGDYDLMEITIERSVCWLVHALPPCGALSLTPSPSLPPSCYTQARVRQCDIRRAHL